MARPESSPFGGLEVIGSKFFHDARGFFTESFRQDALERQGVNCNWVQDNHSRSLPRVLRGLHFQCSPDEQAKLVRVLRGRIWDVAVDLRPDSASFRKYFAVELNEGNGQMLYVPRGFAHGFCVLGDEAADVLYKVDSYYSPKKDGGVRWNDSELAIEWPIPNPLVSEKDATLPVLNELLRV